MLRNAVFCSKIQKIPNLKMKQFEDLKIYSLVCKLTFEKKNHKELRNLRQNQLNEPLLLNGSQ